MKIKDSEKSRILSTNKYNLFKIDESFRFSPERLKILMSEMEEKNISKDFPILVDSEYNILDGRYRYEANKRLGCDVYFKVAEVSEMLDILKAQSISREITYFDFLIYHSDKHSYRILYDYSRNIKENYKVILNDLFNIKINSRGVNSSNFKNGLLDITKEMEFLMGKVDVLKSSFEETYNHIKIPLSEYKLILDQNYYDVDECMKEFNNMPFIKEINKFNGSPYPYGVSILDFVDEVSQMSFNKEFDPLQQEESNTYYGSEVYTHKKDKYPSVKLFYMTHRKSIGGDKIKNTLIEYSSNVNKEVEVD